MVVRPGVPLAVTQRSFKRPHRPHHRAQRPRPPYAASHRHVTPSAHGQLPRVHRLPYSAEFQVCSPSSPSSSSHPTLPLLPPSSLIAFAIAGYHSPSIDAPASFWHTIRCAQWDFNLFSPSSTSSPTLSSYIPPFLVLVPLLIALIHCFSSPGRQSLQENRTGVHIRCSQWRLRCPQRYHSALIAHQGIFIPYLSLGTSY